MNDLPTPARTLVEISVTQSATFLIYNRPTFTREMFIWLSDRDGRYVARMSGDPARDVTDRLPQERWAEIYSKAIAGLALLGRKPEIIEQIF